MREGTPVTVDVINDTDMPEFVHWHGLLIPSDVDGAEEEGTPAFRRTAAAAISSRPNPRARAGITRTPWRRPICIAARTPGNSVS